MPETRPPARPGAKEAQQRSGLRRGDVPALMHILTVLAFMFSVAQLLTLKQETLVWALCVSSAVTFACLLCGFVAIRMVRALGVEVRLKLGMILLFVLLAFGVGAVVGVVTALNIAASPPGDAVVAPVKLVVIRELG